MSQILKRRVANGTESNGLNLSSWKRGRVEQGLRDNFIASSSSHIFNRTFLEQYLIKINPGIGVARGRQEPPN